MFFFSRGENIWKSQNESIGDVKKNSEGNQKKQAHLKLKIREPLEQFQLTVFNTAAKEKKTLGQVKNAVLHWLKKKAYIEEKKKNFWLASNLVQTMSFTTD